MSTGDPSLEGRKQNLSDDEQTLSDSDQSNADLDQTASAVDQDASERDQRASDRDQHAADVDQAVSDEAEGPGSETAGHAEARRTRAANTRERDFAAHARSEAAGVRAQTALRRDRDADARDAAASARDRLAAALDDEIDRLEQAAHGQVNGTGLGPEILLRPARDRQRASAARARAATQREQAARDRALAAQDRSEAAADREQAAEDLAAAGFDHLTGAMRRGVGLIAIQRELDRASRTQEPLVLAFVDVDGLKDVNDEHGHTAGDELLAGVVRCIQSALRPYDVVTRHGGDEFLCLLSGQSIDGVRDRFEAISEQISATQSGATVTVGLVEGSSEEPLDELIERADRTMIATRGGRFARTKGIAQ